MCAVSCNTIFAKSAVARRENRLLETGSHDPRDQPGMVQMRVRQQQTVDVLGRHRERFPVLREVFTLLEHAAVDKQPQPRRLK